MSDARTLIRQVTQDVWTFSRPFPRARFFQVGGRSTAIKLRDGAVWVLASTQLDSETKSKLDEIGTVKYIAAGDVQHWLYLDEFKKAYPSAKLIGVEPLITKQGCPQFDGAYGRDPPETKYGFEDEIQACYFSGFRNKDVAFHHIQSKTLVVADLIFNFPATEQNSCLPQKPLFHTVQFGPYDWLHRQVLRLLTADKEAMKRDARTVASWEIDRIIPCHGDVIESKGDEAWRAAYKAFLN